MAPRRTPEKIAEAKAVEAQFREIFERVPVGAKFSGEDELWLLNHFFPRHPSWKHKKGVGISYVTTRHHPQYFHKELIIVRKDGSWDNISFRECVKPTSDKTCLARAVRQLIDPLVAKFRTDNMGVVDPYNGRTTTAGDAEVDHRKERLADFLERFLVDEGVENPRDILTSKDGQDGHEITEPHRTKILDYHKQSDVFQLLTVSGHDMKHARKKPL
jgi:hypothetical protein